jgi:hypothetical protein
MKKWLPLLIAIAIPLKGAWGDFIESTPVGPGVVHHHEFREIGPWHLHVLQIDLSGEFIRLETVKANDRLYAYERTSSMASRNDFEGHRVVGAVNGDFYASGGIPTGTQVLDGVLLKDPYPNRSTFGVDDDKIPFIDMVTFQGQLFSAGDSAASISGVNETRDENELIVYNKYYGSTTGTNFWGTEIKAIYLDAEVAINDTLRVVASAKDSVHESGHGNNSIPADGLVISGHGTARDFLNEHVFIGDTLSLLIELPPVIEPIVELVGGGPRLIRDGAASVESISEGFGASFASDRHPRTAVGFSQDSTKVYFFTVDGRQAGYSTGMSLYELADYMLEWGVHQGINLDGGGSTTMVVRGQLVNSPSDASGERTVSNALMAVSTAPTGPLAFLRIDPDEVYALVETQVQFSVEGFDQYYNPVAVDLDSLSWSCDAQLGSIDSSGLFTAGPDQTSGHVYANFGNIVDSAVVHITDIATIKLQPSPVILEVGEQQAITAEARDSYENVIELASSEYDWTVVGEMGQISSGGLFTAIQPGDGFIVAAYRSVSGSTAVLVGTPTDVIVDDFSDLSAWTLTGTRVNLSECSLTLDSSEVISPPSSGRLHYSLQTGGTSALYLNGTLPISGTPEAIGIHVYGDGKGHWLRGEFEDADGEKFLVDFTTSSPGIDWTGSWRYQEVLLEDAVVHWGNPSAVLTFPITWKKIYLAETDDAEKDSGTVFLDDFTASFIATKVEEKGTPSLPQQFQLEQNYPNPFNPTTQICFHLFQAGHVRLDIYNTLGQKVRNLVDEQLDPGRHMITFDAEGLASGIYLYQIQSEGHRQIRKMVLLR